MKNVVVSLLALAGVATVASAQTPPMFQPVRAALKYQVAVPGGPWGSSVDILPGQRVEWRVVIDWTDSSTDGGAAGVINALGQIYYQPLVGGADLVGAGADRDSLGAFRNDGRSGANPAGSPNLTAGMLSAAEGENSAALASYGRVVYGFTTRGANSSTSTQNALTAFDHAGASPNGAVNNYIRIAGANNPNPYPATIASPNATLINQILNGVVSDNAAPSASFYAAGIQELVIFRQAFIASSDTAVRSVTITSEVGSARRASSGADDTRFMTWQGSNASTPPGGASSGFTIEGATINIIPAPGAVALMGLGGLMAARRRRA